MNRQKIQAWLKERNMHLITKDDDAVIAAIIRANLERYHLDIPGTAYFDLELDHLSRYYDSGSEARTYFILTEESGRVIGGAGMEKFSGFDRCAELQKLYVAEGWKDRGYGKLLMKTIEEYARAAGFRRLYLETHSNLEVAMRMYEKYGFHLIGRPESVVHSTMDRFYMKEL